jgi:hypothetical protein
LSAASREKGVVARLKEGGSTRVKGLPVRRRWERRPTRLEPRVGERPAGADSGDLEMLRFSLAAGDLGCRSVRGRGEAVREGLVNGTWVSLVKDGA